MSEATAVSDLERSEHENGTKKVTTYGTDGTNLIIPAIDSSTHASTTIDYPHHEVHRGSAYWASHNAVLANGDIITVGIVTPDTTKWSHLLLSVELSAIATFDILEDVTSFAGGAAFTPNNFNRNSENTSGNTVTVGNTGADLIVPTGGTTIWTETLGIKGLTTSRQNASELILKQNSNYLFRITNSTLSNTTAILLTWYEHIDK